MAKSSRLRSRDRVTAIANEYVLDGDSDGGLNGCQSARVTNRVVGRSKTLCLAAKGMYVSAN